MGFASGAIAGYSLAKSSPYERNLMFGNLTEKGYGDALSDWYAGLSAKVTQVVNDPHAGVDLTLASNDNLPAPARL